MCASQKVRTLICQKSPLLHIEYQFLKKKRIFFIYFVLAILWQRIHYISRVKYPTVTLIQGEADPNYFRSVFTSFSRRYSANTEY